ncbi:MAG: Hsp70 family protein [Acidimicrobiales bacterium]
MTYALGIDLGTTYTAAAVARDGRAEVVALGYRATSVPTVVFLAEDGRFLVGDAAERRAGTEPDRVAREFKRRVGDPTPLLLGGSPIAVDRCLAEVLDWVAATIRETEGGPPGAVTVTHPANWGEFKQDVLREALRMADIPNPRLLPEPVAAANWYAQAQRLAPGQTVAVYDLGGGTFDAAVLRRRPDGRFETLGRTEGIDRLGGVDVDQAVLGHVLRTLGSRSSGLQVDAEADPEVDDPATVIAMAQLRESCVEAKEALSSETSVTIPVWLPGLHHQVLLHRTELEDLVGPMLRPTVDALARVVASAGIRPSDLHAVLLVGGSSRIPLISRQVSAAFGRPIAVDAHPKHPVALGAAIDAAAHLAAAPAGGSGGSRPAPVATALAGPSGAPAAARGNGAPPYALAGAPTTVAPGGVGAGAQPRAPWLAGPAGAAPDAPPRPSWPNAPQGSVQDAPSPFRGLPPLRVPPAGSSNPNAGFRAAWIFSIVATVMVLGVSLYFAVWRGETGLGGPTTDVTTGVGNPRTTVSPGADDGGTTGSDTSAAAGNLFSDPQAAWDAFASIPGGPRIHEITLYDTYAFTRAQSEAEPEFVDEYQYRDGGVSGPEEAIAVMVEGEELAQSYFDLSAVAPTAIPGLVQQACQGTNYVVSHVFISRLDGFEVQPEPFIRVYSGNPDRSGTGGYITFAPDGTVLANYCD